MTRTSGPNMSPPRVDSLRLLSRSKELPTVAVLGLVLWAVVVAGSAGRSRERGWLLVVVVEVVDLVSLLASMDTNQSNCHLVHGNRSLVKFKWHKWFHSYCNAWIIFFRLYLCTWNTLNSKNVWNLNMFWSKIPKIIWFSEKLYFCK